MYRTSDNSRTNYALGHAIGFSAAFCIVLVLSVWTSDASDDGGASFNGLYASRGADDDADGLVDHIDIDIGLDVKKSGIYKVKASLYDSVGNETILEPMKDFNLKFGVRTVALKFYGTFQPGAYFLRDLTLYNDRDQVQDNADEAYTTQAYFNLDPEPQLAKLAGRYSDSGTDTDGDGKYEFLTMDVGVDVMFPGQYTLTGYLYDHRGSEIAWTMDNDILDPGYHIMHLNFDGAPIERHGVNGPYRLGKLFLTGKNLKVKDTAKYASDTSAYNYTDFAAYNRSEREKVISGIGYGELLMTIIVQISVPASSGTYDYDLIGINIPPISTPWQVTRSEESGYSYTSGNVYIPGRPNNFTVSAAGVKNLNVGLKKLPEKGGINTTRIWVTAQAQADLQGTAAAETDLLSPGNYHAKIFGDAAENVTKVNLTLTAVKKISVNGSFDLTINTTGFPAGDYSFNVKALNGTLRLDEISVQG